MIFIGFPEVFVGFRSERSPTDSERTRTDSERIPTDSNGFQRFLGLPGRGPGEGIVGFRHSHSLETPRGGRRICHGFVRSTPQLNFGAVGVFFILLHGSCNPGNPIPSSISEKSLFSRFFCKAAARPCAALDSCNPIPSSTSGLSWFGHRRIIQRAAIFQNKMFQWLHNKMFQWHSGVQR